MPSVSFLFNPVLHSPDLSNLKPVTLKRTRSHFWVLISVESLLPDATTTWKPLGLFLTPQLFSWNPPFIANFRRFFFPIFPPCLNITEFYMQGDLRWGFDPPTEFFLMVAVHSFFEDPLFFPHPNPRLPLRFSSLSQIL